MNRPIREAINEGFPLRWEADGIGGFGVKLVATTFTYENGTVRERKLWHTFDRRSAQIMHAQIAGFHGKLEGPGPDQVYNEWKQRREDSYQEMRRAGVFDRTSAAEAAGKAALP